MAKTDLSATQPDDSCHACGACSQHQRCDHCGKCRRCGQAIAGTYATNLEAIHAAAAQENWTIHPWPPNQPRWTWTTTWGMSGNTYTYRA